MGHCIDGQETVSAGSNIDVFDLSTGMVSKRVDIANRRFGGWQRSMFGDLYAYGPNAIRLYTRRKTIAQK